MAPSAHRDRRPLRARLRSLAAGAVAACAFCGPAGAADPAPWIVAADIAFPPYAYLDTATGQPAGVDTEIVTAALQAAGQPFEIRLYPWERAKKVLDGGQADAAYQFAGTPERRAQYRLAGPIRYGITVFMARTDGPADYQQLADLSSYVIGTVHGFSYTEAFDQANLKRDNSAPTVEQLLRKLMARRVDIIVGDRYQLLHLAGQLGVARDVRIVGKPLAEVPRFVGFRKEDEEKAQRFERGLEIIRRNGTLAKILARWDRGG